MFVRVKVDEQQANSHSLKRLCVVILLELNQQYGQTNDNFVDISRECKIVPAGIGLDELDEKPQELTEISDPT